MRSRVPLPRPSPTATLTPRLPPTHSPTRLRQYSSRFDEAAAQKRYFLEPPESPRHNRLFLTTDSERRHMYFLTLEQEEGFFDYPGKS